MVVIISSNVFSKIDEYIEALTMYPISKSRAHQKIDKMLNSLINLGNSILTPQICLSKDLGQVCTSDGQPIYKNLKRFNYKDESGFQWSFACLYNDNDNRITIVKMMPSNQICEEIECITHPILEFWERLNRI